MVAPVEDGHELRLLELEGFFFHGLEQDILGRTGCVGNAGADHAHQFLDERAVLVLVHAPAPIGNVAAAEAPHEILFRGAVHLGGQDVGMYVGQHGEDGLAQGSFLVLQAEIGIVRDDEQVDA